MKAYVNKVGFLKALMTVVMIALIVSCAAAVNIIAPSAWIGALDVIAAVAISVFILNGNAK